MAHMNSQRYLTNHLESEDAVAEKDADPDAGDLGGVLSVDAGGGESKMARQQMIEHQHGAQNILNHREDLPYPSHQAGFRYLDPGKGASRERIMERRRRDKLCFAKPCQLDTTRAKRESAMAMKTQGLAPLEAEFSGHDGHNPPQREICAAYRGAAKALAALRGASSGSHESMSSAMSLLSELRNDCPSPNFEKASEGTRACLATNLSMAAAVYAPL